MHMHSHTGGHGHHIIIEIGQHALMITAFVMAMMIAVEYINIYTEQKLKNELIESRLKQYILSLIFGLIPGCLGSFTLVTLYTHGLVGIGALTAGMIASSGDEAFMMFAMIPEKSIFIMLGLALVGLVFGVITDKLIKKRTEKHSDPKNCFTLHEEDADPLHYSIKHVSNQLRNCTMARGILLVGLTIFLLALITSIIGPDHWDLMKILLTSVTLFSLFVICIVPDHFLEEHLWKHIAKKHVPSIFLWTLAALGTIEIINQFVSLKEVIHQNPAIVLLIAILTGLIPQSGPHLLFLTMYTKGLLPISILFANSIVQDGHGMLPLLAHSRKDFLLVKTINMLAGLIIGYAMLSFGF
jgi:hypothetical protein